MSDFLTKLGDGLIQAITPTAMLAVVAFFIQNALKNSAAKSIERFKSEQALELNKQGKLHERRLEVIDTVQKKMVELLIALGYMFMKKKDYDINKAAQEEEKSIQDAQRILRDFSTFVLSNAHFFKSQHANILYGLISGFSSTYQIKFELQRIVENNIQLTSEEWKEKTKKDDELALMRLQKELPEAIEIMSAEFRKLLGVEE